MFDNLPKTIDLYLRYFFAGAIFLISLTIIEPYLFDYMLRITIIDNLTMSLFINILLGVIIYSIYRALIYPFIYNKILKMVRRNFSIYSYPTTNNSLLESTFYLPHNETHKILTPSILEMQIDKTRWKGGPSFILIPTSSAYSEWASQIHFLYTSALAILLSLVTCMILKYYDRSDFLIYFSSDTNYVGLGISIFGLIIFSVAGYYHHYRYLYFTLHNTTTL